MEHNYFDEIKKEYINQEQSLISLAKEDYELYLYAINNHDTGYDLDKLIEHHEEAKQYGLSPQNINDIENALEFYSIFFPGESVSYVEDYRKAKDKYEKYLSKFNKIEDMINLIKRVITIEDVETSYKSISTYISISVTYENYNNLGYVFDFDDDYYEEQSNDDNLDLTEKNDFDKFIKLNKINKLVVRISDHDVGGFYSEYNDRYIKYDDKSIKVSI